MSLLNRDTLERLFYERSKFWASFMDRCREDGQLLHTRGDYDWAEHYNDEKYGKGAFDPSLEADEDNEEERSVPQHDASHSNQAPFEKACLQVACFHGKNIELEKDDIAVFNKTRSLLVECERRWEAAGIFNILNTFEMGKIKKVGSWIRHHRPEGSYIELPALSNDSDNDSEHSADDAGQPHTSRNRACMYSAIKTTVQKKYVVMHSDMRYSQCCDKRSSFADSSLDTSCEANARKKTWHYASCNSRYVSSTNKVTKKKLCFCARKHQRTTSSSPGTISRLLELLGNDPRLAKKVCDQFRPENRFYQQSRHIRDESPTDDSLEITYMPPGTKNVCQMIPQRYDVNYADLGNMVTIKEKIAHESRECTEVLKEAYAENKLPESRDRAEKKLQQRQERTCAIKEAQAEYKLNEMDKLTKLLQETYVEEKPKKSPECEKAFAGPLSTESYDHPKEIKKTQPQTKRKPGDKCTKGTKAADGAEKQRESNVRVCDINKAQTEGKPKESGERFKDSKGELVGKKPMESQEIKNAYPEKKLAESREIKEIQAQKNPKESRESIKETKGESDEKKAKESNVRTFDIKKVRFENKPEKGAQRTGDMKDVLFEGKSKECREVKKPFPERPSEIKTNETKEMKELQSKDKPQESRERTVEMKETRIAKKATDKDERANKTKKGKAVLLSEIKQRETPKRICKMNPQNNAQAKTRKTKVKAQTSDENEDEDEQRFQKELEMALKISRELYDCKLRLSALMIGSGIEDNSKESHISAAASAAPSSASSSNFDAVQKQTEHTRSTTSAINPMNQTEEVTPTAHEHDISAVAFKTPQHVPLKFKTSQPTRGEDTFLKDSSNICNSTALPNNSVANRQFFDITQSKTAPQAQKGASSTSQSRLEPLVPNKISADAAAKSFPHQAGGMKSHVPSTVPDKFKHQRQKPQPILVYKPDDRLNLPERSFVDEKFILTETHLSTIIGPVKARKVFKQWQGQRLFDASTTLFYREGERSGDCSSDSDEDPLERVEKIGIIYQVPNTSGWESISNI